MGGDSVLFENQLSYHIKTGKDNAKEPIRFEDLKGINLQNCRFDDFKKVMNYIRDNYPDYYFSDATIGAVKPRNYIESKKYDFLELSEFAKHMAITIGNMSLFCELQKLASAVELANVTRNELEIRKDNYSLSNNDIFGEYYGYSTFEELGSCVIGGGIGGSYKLTATFHESSQEAHPIISIRTYSINTGLYSTNRDVIDLTTIYKPNATLMEAFAYLCCKDYMNNKNDHSSWSPASKSFDRLLNRGKFTIESLDDMYSEHVDLTEYVFV